MSVTQRGILELQEAAVRFAESIAPGQPTRAKICHLCREVQELHEAPTDHMEMADVLLLLLQVAARAKVSGPALIECAWTKLDLVKSRQWGQPDADGVVEHVREAQP